MPNRPSHLSRRRVHLPLWRVILSDIITAALILGLYAVFKLVIPAALSSAARPARTPAATPAPVVEAAESAEPAGLSEQDKAQEPVWISTDSAPEQVPAEVTPEPTPAPTPDNRTPWQIKFAEHFTDETVITDHSYTSPEVSINIESFSVEENGWTSVYHVADIYIASMENFKTYTVDGALTYWSTADMMDLDRESGAILAISGDFYSYQQTGFMMRNGEIYAADNGRADICVLYADGVMETYAGSQYNVDEILARNPVQVWQFGPAMLDAEGRAMTRFPTAQGTVNQPNPRSAIGYYEPGHYCFVVVDGRQDGYSHGLLLPGLSTVFEQLGCTCAYNLDGGGSAVMTFNHERFSRQSNGGNRKLGDILLITEAGFSGAGLEG